MDRDEFLKILKESLSMSLEQDAINEQLEYYDRYISDEIKKGRDEKEVIEELGDPRLIAKTIKTVSKTNEINDGGESYHSDSTNYNNSYNNTGNTGSNNNNRYSTFVDTTGIGCVIAGLVVFIIVALIFRMFGYMVYGLGSLALSGPIGFMIVAMLIFLFMNRGRR